MIDDQFAWRLAAELVRIESTDPGTYEDAIEKHIKYLVEQHIETLPDWLSEAIRITEVEALPNRRDLMVRVAGTSAEPALVYSCHMDTVTLGEGWDDATPALGGVVAGERLYGRGACDMKGGLACAIAAFFSLLDEAAAQGSLPRRAFALLLSVDEEDFMRGVEAAISAGLVGADEWVVDTEPTDGQVQVAHKGRTWFEVTMTGQTAHASQPWKGADAVAAMATMPGSAHRTVELCRKAGVRFDAIDHCTVLARTIPEDIRSDELTHVASVFAVSARMAALESLQGTLMRA